MATEFEMNMNAVERVDHYSNIDTEPSPTDDDIKPNDDWPQKGEIRDLKQTRTATAVNKQLNFTVKNKPHTTNYIYCIFYD